MMRIDILTIFPQLFPPFLLHGMVHRARQLKTGDVCQQRALEIRLTDLRDFTGDRHSSVDDRPYGGELPNYHRLDVSVERVFVSGNTVVTLQAGAINVYDRANLFSLDLFTLHRTDQLPLIPTVGIKFEF